MSYRAPADSSTADAGPQVTSGGLQEIVVTARKRAEDIQQTPIAITAFTSDDLESHGIVAIQNLAAQTPSLSFQSSPYDSVGSYIGMRGQQATDIVITQTPPVGAVSRLGIPAGAVFRTDSIRQDVDMVTARINYHFNWWGAPPVAARY